MVWTFSVLIHITVETLPPTVHTGARALCPYWIGAVRLFWKLEMSLHYLSVISLGLLVKLNSLSHVISHFLILCELLICVFCLFGGLCPFLIDLTTLFYSDPLSCCK